MGDSPNPVQDQHLGARWNLRLQRADKRNALAAVHWRALADALAKPDQARVLVLSGLPGAFSAGADIEELASLLTDPTRFGAHNALVQDTQRALERLPLPTVAAIDGVCVGGGLGLALACDLRLATQRARFAITPVKLGLVYSVDDTRRLVAAVGSARARELLLSGRSVDAEEALRIGLVHRLVPQAELDATVDALATELAALSRTACAGIKQVLAHLAGDPAVDAARARAAFDDAFHAADFAEGARAFLERRPPHFG